MTINGGFTNELVDTCLENLEHLRAAGRAAGPQQALHHGRFCVSYDADDEAMRRRTRVKGGQHSRTAHGAVRGRQRRDHGNATDATDAGMEKHGVGAPIWMRLRERAQHSGCAGAAHGHQQVLHQLQVTLPDGIRQLLLHLFHLFRVPVGGEQRGRVGGKRVGGKRGGGGTKRHRAHPCATRPTPRTRIPLRSRLTLRRAWPGAAATAAAAPDDGGGCGGARRRHDGGTTMTARRQHDGDGAGGLAPGETG